MKHIKYFESKNDYYTKIDEKEFPPFDLRIHFTKKELNTLNSFSPTNPLEFFFINDKRQCVKLPSRKKELKVKLIWLKPSNPLEHWFMKQPPYPDEYTICKTDDDWFYVLKDLNRKATGTIEVYYKCDQMSGLVQFLKDEKAIK